MKHLTYQQEMKVKRWSKKPLVMYFFLGLQTLVFIRMLFPNNYTALGGMYGPAIAMGDQYWRFFTPIIIHANLAHFAMNSVVLYFMGEQVENLYGHWRFFVIYLFSGMLGNLASFAFNTPGTLAIGASSSIFGLFGAFLILGKHFPENYVIQNLVKRFTLFVGFNLVFNLFDQGIDIWGHIGGLVGGLLLGGMVALPQAKERYSTSMRILATIIFLFIVGFCFALGLKNNSFPV